MFVGLCREGAGFKDLVGVTQCSVSTQQTAKRL